MTALSNKSPFSKITILFVLFSTFSSAQIQSVVPNIHVRQLITDGAIVYAVEGQGNAATYDIVKIDVSQQNPTPINVLTGLQGTEDVSITIEGNDVYVAEPSNHRIFKIDKTATTPSPINVYTGNSSFSPEKILIHNNEIYYLQYFNTADPFDWYYKILKIDLSLTNPTPVEVSPRITECTEMILENDMIYYNESVLARIHKFDLMNNTHELIYDGFNYPSMYLDSAVYGIAIKGTTMFALNHNYLITLDLDNTQTAPIVLTNSDVFLRQFITDGPADCMYFQYGNTTNPGISKLCLSALSISENEWQNIRLYPNPMEDFLKVSGVKSKSTYTIYTLTGKKIRSGTVSDQEKINVQTLTSGLYFLKFSDGFVQKLLKK